MDINIIQWNINLRSSSSKIAEFLKSEIQEKPSIVCLEEVVRSTFEALIQELKPDGFSYSLDLRVTEPSDGLNRKLGVLIMVFGGTITKSALMEKTYFPERTLAVLVEIGHTKLSIATFHSLTGVGYGKEKANNFANIAEYLAKNQLDFLCFDANEPKIDSLDIEKLVFWDNGDEGKKASLIMGKDRVHGLSDSLRTFLESTNNKIDQNPLAISWQSRNKKANRRYDYIFHYSTWIPNEVKYLYQEGISASSDHALVKGKFQTG